MRSLRWTVNRDHASEVASTTATAPSERVRSESIRMKTIRVFLHHRIAWAVAGALLAFVGLPVMVALLMKALSLAQDTSLHSWLLDVGHNMKALGAAGGVGAGAAAAGEPTAPKDKDPDPCAGEARAVLQDLGTVDMYKGQINAVANRITKLANPMNQLVEEAQKLAPQAQSEVEQQFIQSAITELMQLLAEESGLGGGAAAVSSAVGLVTDPAGAVVSAADENHIVEGVNFLKEMYRYFQISQGDLNALEEFCKENPMPVASQFLNVMDQLKQNVAQGYALVNEINQIQNQLQDAQNKLIEDQKALKDCQDSNSGAGDAGADV